MQVTELSKKIAAKAFAVKNVQNAVVKMTVEVPKTLDAPYGVDSYGLLLVAIGTLKDTARTELTNAFGQVKYMLDVRQVHGVTPGHSNHVARIRHTQVEAFVREANGMVKLTMCVYVPLVNEGFPGSNPWEYACELIDELVTRAHAQVNKGFDDLARRVVIRQAPPVTILVVGVVLPHKGEDDTMLGHELEAARKALPPAATKSLPAPKPAEKDEELPIALEIAEELKEPVRKGWFKKLFGG